jgi:hypothetical protein
MLKTIEKLGAPLIYRGIVTMIDGKPTISENRMPDGVAGAQLTLLPMPITGRFPITTMF